MNEEVWHPAVFTKNRDRGLEGEIAEEFFGRMKTVALQRMTRFRGPDKVGWVFTFAAAASNLVRMRNLRAQPA